MNFKHILGNEKNKEILEKIIKTNKIANSYLFIGKSGIGKKLFAKEFAKALLEIDENQELLHPDYTFIDSNGGEKQNIIEVNQIKKDLIHVISKSPIKAKRRVFIIDEAEKMNIVAQNAFLKTLEETPAKAVIILICSDKSKLLPTIISRCVQINFSNIENDIIKKYLENNEIECSKEIIKICDGSFEKVMNIKKYKEDLKQFSICIKNILNKNTIEALNSIEEYSKETNKEKMILLLDYLNVILFEKGLYNKISIVEKAKEKIQSEFNYNKEMILDEMIMNII